MEAAGRVLTNSTLLCTSIAAEPIAPQTLAKMVAIGFPQESMVPAYGKSLHPPPAYTSGGFLAQSVINNLTSTYRCVSSCRDGRDMRLSNILLRWKHAPSLGRDSLLWRQFCPRTIRHVHRHRRRREWTHTHRWLGWRNLRSKSFAGVGVLEQA